jgi:hypothetical protein
MGLQGRRRRDILFLFLLVLVGSIKLLATMVL